MPRPWTVLPHGPLEKLEPNLWAVEGTIKMPAGELSRRMCIARLGDGRLFLMNGVPLREEAMREMEAFGKPAFLLVPNGYHRLDIAAYKQRYPQLRVLAGEGPGRGQLERRSPRSRRLGGIARRHQGRRGGGVRAQRRARVAVLLRRRADEP